jgi:hypothetical protein
MTKENDNAAPASNTVANFLMMTLPAGGLRLRLICSATARYRRAR